MSRYRWTLALALGFVAVGVATLGDAAMPATAITPAPSAVAERTQGAPQVEIGPAVLRVYDGAGRVIYEE